MALKTNYENDVLDTSKNKERVYNIYDENNEIIAKNARINDNSSYLQTGTNFGAKDINDTNTIINSIVENNYEFLKKNNLLTSLSYDETRKKYEFDVDIKDANENYTIGFNTGRNAMLPVLESENVFFMIQTESDRGYACGFSILTSSDYAKQTFKLSDYVDIPSTEKITKVTGTLTQEKAPSISEIQIVKGTKTSYYTPPEIENVPSNIELGKKTDITATSTKSPLENTTNGNIRSIRLVGNSYKSANLFDKKLLTDKTMYKQWSVNPAWLEYNIKVKPNTTYTFNAKNITLSGIKAFFWKYNNPSEYYTYIVNAEVRATPFSFTTDANAEYVTFLVLDSEFEDMAEWKDVTLVEGTTFGLIIPGGNIESRTKNYFWGDLEIGTLNVNTGLNENSDTKCRTKEFLKVNNNTTYYYQKKISGGGFFLYEYDKNKTFIKFTDGSGLGGTITTQNNTKYIRLRFNSIIDSEEQEIMIIEGNTRTDSYIKGYYSTVHTDRLLASVNELKNEIVDWKFRDNLGIVDLGDLGWQKAEDTRFVSESLTLCKNYAKTEKANAICDSYDVVNRDNLVAKTLSIHYSDSKNWINIIDNAFSGKTVTEVKTMLSGKKLIYELANPTVTDLTKEEVAELLSLKTYEGQTYIDADGAEFEVSYFKNNEIGNAIAEVDKKVNEVASDVAELTINESFKLLVSGLIKYRKVGNLTNVFSNTSNTTLTKNAWTTIATLPENYRPNTEIYTTCIVGNTLGGTGAVRIKTDGSIQYYTNFSGDLSTIIFNVWF